MDVTKQQLEARVKQLEKMIERGNKTILKLGEALAAGAVQYPTLAQATPAGPTIPNLKQFAAQLAASLPDEEREDEDHPFTVDGLGSRIEEIYGDGWTPPDPYGDKLHPSQVQTEEE